MSTSVNTSLWMGDVAPEMDENFIINAFAQMGEKILKVKIMTSGKYPNSGHAGRYCFVEFPDYESAQKALQRLNGTYIPGTPGKRFKLNTSNRDQKSSTDYSLYVGDLASYIDESSLCTFFENRYPSVHTAKVIYDPSGISKGFGFVRFSDESEQQKALVEMQHVTGLGDRPLKVSLATAKRPDSSSNYGSSYNQYQYYPDQQAWGDYNYQYNNQQGYDSSGSYPTNQDSSAHKDNKQQNNTAVEDDPETLEDPGLEINISKENREFIVSSESFFTALERSRWQPLDSIMSEIPD